MTLNWKGWEAWQFIRDESSGHFIITSWTHTKKVLGSGPDGRVFTTESKDYECSWEKWRVAKHPNSEGLMIESVEHHRLLAFSGQDLCTTNNEEGTNWFLEPAHGYQFFVSTPSLDKRLSSNNEHPFTSHNRKAWEKWIIEPTNQRVGQYSIRSMEHGKFLGSQGDDRIVVSEKKHFWTIGASTDAEGGGYHICSTQHNKRLAIDHNGNLYMKEGAGDGNELWDLECILPHTITGKQILIGSGATAAAAIATPFALMGVVGAMGFGTGGIAAGSLGAWMMSLEGSVAAGGVVATLQSIGAAGLGLGLTSMAVGAGAITGGLTSLGLINVINGSGAEQEKITIDEPAQHLPLCSWRLWQ